MTNLNRLIRTIYNVVGYDMDKEIYKIAVKLIYNATQEGYIVSRDLGKLEIALCKKLRLDLTEVWSRYYNIKEYIKVDDIICYYGIENDLEIYLHYYDTNIIKFKEKCYEFKPCSDREYDLEYNELDDNSDF